MDRGSGEDRSALDRGAGLVVKQVPTPAGVLVSSDYVREIEDIVTSTGADYIDAVVTWCNKNGVDVEHVASLIKKDAVLKSKLLANAENLNLMKTKSARLPI